MSLSHCVTVFLSIPDSRCPKSGMGVSPPWVGAQMMLAVTVSLAINFWRLLRQVQFARRPFAVLQTLGPWTALGYYVLLVCLWPHVPSRPHRTRGHTLSRVVGSPSVLLHVSVLLRRGILLMSVTEKRN